MSELSNSPKLSFALPDDHFRHLTLAQTVTLNRVEMSGNLSANARHQRSTALIANTDREYTKNTDPL